jgi:Polysaccharide pyruvyl transferase
MQYNKSNAMIYKTYLTQNPSWTLDERVRYFNRGEPTQNFGDYLPELIAAELFLQPRVEADVYRLIGSVIDITWLQRDLRYSVGSKNGTIALWGCGARTDNCLKGKVPDDYRFFGVRGPLTRDLLGLEKDTVLGDPGLLAPIFHQPQGNSETKGKRICIPHIHDLRPKEDLLKMSGADMLVSPLVDSNLPALKTLLNKIAEADFILTASLHGAIVACAYNRPFAFWDNGHLDIEFKWRDFSASIGIKSKFAKSVSEGERLFEETIRPNFKIPPLVPILDICPFYVRPSALLKAAEYDGMLSVKENKEVTKFFSEIKSYSHQETGLASAIGATYRKSNQSIITLLRRHCGYQIEQLKSLIRSL